MTPTVLSLCDFTGNWSRPYEEAGFKVIRADLKNGRDVRFLERIADPVVGILAAPPCTVFAGSGARWVRTSEEMACALSLVDACLRAVVIYRPLFWALENPVGKLVRWLGEPRLIFQPCQYGDPYTKKTCLWGDFNIPRRRPVMPTEGSKMWSRYGGKSERTKAARSETPMGFARAFFEANQPNVARQMSLPGAVNE